MIKTTVEEIEILVTARVEDNLRQNMPKIRDMVEKIRQQFEKTDTTGLEKNVKQSINQASSAIKQIAPRLKQNFNNIVDDKSRQKIIELEKEIAKLEKQINSKQLKLDITNNALDTIREDTKQKNIAEMPDAGAKRINNATLLDLSNNDNFNSMVAESDKLASSIDKDNTMLEAAKSKLQELRANVEQVTQSQSKWSAVTNAFKQGIKSAGQSISSISSKIKSAFSKVQGVLSKVKNNIKSAFSGNGIKGGLRQVLRYAGALLSIRSVYMMLRQSANAWLSSSNREAQQLNANLQYMQYAMGSALSPIIEYLINLMYQLMKAVQSVVYALTGINIFAKASAKSYSNMANSAKQTAKETKKLAGIDEITNIGGDDNNSSGGGNGNVAPNIDLSDVDTSLVDKFKNLDFEELGKQLGKKINSALESIPWNEIQNTARTIAGNIAKFLNGYIETTDWNLVGNTFAQGINTVLYAGETFVNTFKWDNLGKAMGNGLNGLFENIDWGARARMLSGGIKGIFDTISGFFETFSWKGIIDGLITSIKEFKWNDVSDAIFKALGSACASLVNLGQVIGGHIKNAFTNIGKYFNKEIEECGGNVVLGILKGIGDAVIGIGTWIKDHIFTPFIDGFKNVFKIHSPSQVMVEMAGYIIEGLKNGLIGIWDKIKEIFTSLKDKIKTKFIEIKDKVKEIAGNIKDGVKDRFYGMRDKAVEAMASMKDKVRTKAYQIWDTIKGAFANIPNWFKDKFSTAWKKVKDVFSKGGKVFTGIKDGILKSLKSIINALISGINKIIKIPFDGLNRTLQRIKNVKIFELRPFDFIKTINVPQIPKLATGNVATEETLAIFGEYAGASTNPEITAPQNIIYETTKQAIIDSSTTNNNSSSMPREIVIKFGSYRVALEVEELIRKARRQNGTATVTI